MRLEESFYRDLGVNIKALRTLRAISQEDLADELGLTRTSITNIEKGIQKVSLFNLYKIAIILKVRADELLPNFNNFKKQLRLEEIGQEPLASEKIMKELGII